MTSVSLLRLRVLQAAQVWWANKRPKGWYLEEHLKDPGINCTREDVALACAVGALMKESWQNDDATPLVRGLYNLVKQVESGKPGKVDRHTVMRSAEAFLELRNVGDTPVPTERVKRKGTLLK
jgi:hypothetical protein